MQLILDDDEVQAYFALQEEHSDLLTKVSELTGRLVAAQHTIGRLEDQLSTKCTAVSNDTEEHY